MSGRWQRNGYGGGARGGYSDYNNGYGYGGHENSSEGHEYGGWENYGGGDNSGGYGYGSGSGYGGYGYGNGGNWGRDLDSIQLEAQDYTGVAGFRKNFYTENAVVTQRSEQEVVSYRAEKQITAVPPNAPRPLHSFEEAGFPDYLMTKIQEANFTEPTPIQSQSWPLLLSGFDVVGLAETGSGKTLAFLLPGVVHLMDQPDLAANDGPTCLIMAPTRELACQIQAECEKFGSVCQCRSLCVYGGAKKAPQMQELRRGVHILVATPGRLIDMLEAKVTNLRRVTYLVLDEADRMLDMGFEPQIRKIVNQIRPDRQTVLCSATWPKEVEEIAADFLKDPVKVIIGSPDLRANHNITQCFKMMRKNEKFHYLLEFLNSETAEMDRILIFCQTKRIVDEVTGQLRQAGWNALSIHGDKQQSEREWVLEEFKTGSSPVLLATDVAARGLDVKDIKIVVNYDMPMTGEDYVHRIGRTGRAGAHGTAISFFTDMDARIAKPIIKVLEEAGQEVPSVLYNYASHSGSEPGFRARGMYNAGGGRGYSRTGANAMPVGRRGGFGGGGRGGGGRAWRGGYRGGGYGGDRSYGGYGGGGRGRY